jgi:hypothetical protein
MSFKSANKTQVDLVRKRVNVSLSKSSTAGLELAHDRTCSTVMKAPNPVPVCVIVVVLIQQNQNRKLKTLIRLAKTSSGMSLWRVTLCQDLLCSGLFLKPIPTKKTRQTTTQVVSICHCPKPRVFLATRSRRGVASEPSCCSVRPPFFVHLFFNNRKVCPGACIDLDCTEAPSC